MIVYEKDKKRYDNFIEIKNIINDLIYFKACDSINNLDKYIDLNTKYNFNSVEYIDTYKINNPGKIGCNMSHAFLLKEISENLNIKDNDWILILEDDIELDQYNEDNIKEICEIADNNNSEYIQLFTNSYYYHSQINQKKISNNLFKMIPQWHTTAFLIKKSGVNKIINKFPMNNNIDEFYSQNINLLNSLCFINKIFLNKGASGPHDLNSKFGSLIWKI